MLSISEGKPNIDRPGVLLVCVKCSQPIIGPQIRDMVRKLQDNPDAPIEHTECPK